MGIQVNRKSDSGFTLLELIVCVAVLGILTSIAGESFRKYQARARSAEAKIALSALYVAEESFAPENGSYTACLANTGFVVDSPTRYFRVGFSAAQAALNDCGRTGDQPCNQVNWPASGGPGTACSLESGLTASEPFAYPANTTLPGTPALPGDSQMPLGLALSSNYFVAAAVNGSPDTLAKAGSGSVLDWLESSALAEDGSDGGDGNRGPGSGSSSNIGSSPQDNTPAPPPVRATCTNPTSAWTMDSSHHLQLTQICPGN